MEAARSPETLVNFYQTKRRYSPEDSHLRTHRREDLKSYSQKTAIFILVDVRSVNLTYIYILMNLFLNVKKPSFWVQD
jgi:hypothetical protein